MSAGGSIGGGTPTPPPTPFSQSLPAPANAPNTYLTQEVPVGGLGTVVPPTVGHTIPQMDPGAVPWVDPSGWDLQANAEDLSWQTAAKQLVVGGGTPPIIVGSTGGYAHSYVLTIPTPANAQVGDWLYVVLGSTCHLTSTPDLTLPAGWTLVHAYVCPTANAHQVIIGKRQLTGVIPASYAFNPVPSLPTDPYVSGSLTCLRGVNGTETALDFYDNDDPTGLTTPLHLGQTIALGNQAALLWTWSWNGMQEQAGVTTPAHDDAAHWFGRANPGGYGASLWSGLVTPGQEVDPWFGNWTGIAWAADWQLVQAGLILVDGYAPVGGVTVNGPVNATNALTSNQKDALAGTAGTPSASNPYVTTSDARVAGAFHKSGLGEIASLAEKVTPAAADVLVIEDSVAGNAKKKVQVGNLPHGGGGGGGSLVTSYRGPTNYAIAASAAWTDVPDYLLSITTTAGQNVLITLALDLYHDNPGSDSTYGLRFTVDGVEVVETWSFIGLQHDCNMSFCAPVAGLAAGAHTVKLQFYGYNTDTLKFCKGVFAALQL